MTDPKASPSHLLSLATDVAYTAADPGRRTSLVVQVAVAAARLGVLEIPTDALLDLPEPDARGRLHLALAGAGPGARGGHHLQQAEGEVLRAERWDPLPGWMSPADAWSALATAYGCRGDVSGAARCAAHIPPGRVAHASAAIAVVDALAEGPSTEQTASWSQALAACLQIESDPDARRALEQLALRAITHRWMDRVGELIGFVSTSGRWEWHQRARFCEAVAAALAAADLPTARGWQEAVSLARTAGGDAHEPVSTLCRVAKGQLASGRVQAAITTFQIALSRVQDTPLPPDPNARFPWRPLFRTACLDPRLGLRLGRVLRLRGVLPPSWCYALARLDLAAGDAHSARRMADMLVSSFWTNPSDVEALWLAALLRCACGDIAVALEEMSRALSELGDEPLVELPGSDGGTDRIEVHFVDALITAEALDEAVSLARAVPDAGLRAALLRRVAVSWRSGLQPPSMLAVVAEALDALERSSPTNVAAAGELAGVLWQAGEAEAAMGALAAGLDRCRGVPPLLQAPSLHALLRWYRELGARSLEQRVLEAGLRCARMSADVHERCEILLGMAEAVGSAGDQE